jgi:hypothetical protein
MIAADVTHISDSDINMQGQILLGIADHRAKEISLINIGWFNETNQRD